MAETQTMITITVTVIVKGRAFKPNEQYCYTTKFSTQVGCGCGGKAKETQWFYKLVLDSGIEYDIPAERAVESTVPISCRDQSFEDAREAIGDTDDVKDFNPYRVNNDPYEIAKKANNIPM